MPTPLTEVLISAAGHSSFDVERFEQILQDNGLDNSVGAATSVALAFEALTDHKRIYLIERLSAVSCGRGAAPLRAIVPPLLENRRRIEPDLITQFTLDLHLLAYDYGEGDWGKRAEERLRDPLKSRSHRAWLLSKASEVGQPMSRAYLQQILEASPPMEADPTLAMALLEFAARLQTEGIDQGTLPDKIAEALPLLQPGAWAVTRYAVPVESGGKSKLTAQRLLDHLHHCIETEESQERKTLYLTDVRLILEFCTRAVPIGRGAEHKIIAREISRATSQGVDTSLAFARILQSCRDMWPGYICVLCHQRLDTLPEEALSLNTVIAMISGKPSDVTLSYRLASILLPWLTHHIPRGPRNSDDEALMNQMLEVLPIDAVVPWVNETKPGLRRFAFTHMALTDSEALGSIALSNADRSILIRHPTSAVRQGTILAPQRRAKRSSALPRPESEQDAAPGQEQPPDKTRSRPQ